MFVLLGGGILLIFGKEAHILSVRYTGCLLSLLDEGRFWDWGSPSTLKQALFPLLIPLQT